MLPNRWHPGPGFALLTILVAVSWTGCGSSSSSGETEAKFDYGRDAMRSAIEGTWEGTSRLGAGGADAPMTMTMTYAAPDAKTLCNNRVLSRDGTLVAGDEPGAVAPQCIAMSSVNVTGTMTAQLDTSEAPRDLAVRGWFEVMSLRFDGHGALSIEVDGRHLDARVANDVLEGDLSGQDQASTLKFSLHRRK